MESWSERKVGLLKLMSREHYIFNVNMEHLGQWPVMVVMVKLKMTTPIIVTRRDLQEQK